MRTSNTLRTGSGLPKYGWPRAAPNGSIHPVTRTHRSSSALSETVDTKAGANQRVASSEQAVRTTSPDEERIRYGVNGSQRTRTDADGQ